MVAVAVAADNLRADPMDATTNISGIGGGAGAGIEEDVFYQNAAAISRKVTAGGFATSTGGQQDLTAIGRKTVMLKVMATNYGGITDLEARIGSASGAYYAYTLADNTTIPYPAAGGFLILPIDPNIAGYRDGTTGSPAITAADWFGFYLAGPTSKAENLIVDAVDIGVGLYLTGGDGASADGTFQDFIDDDEGDTVNGRFGYVSTKEGVLFVFGQVIIGATSASGVLTAAATGFSDSGQTIVFPDGRFANGFSGLTLVATNASTDISLDGNNFVGRGSTTTTDTRPTLDAVGTAGAISIACSLTNFSTIALNSAISGAATFNQCDEITMAGADLSGATFNQGTGASAVIWNETSDIDTYIDGASFVSAGTGHAIEFGTSAPLTLNLNSVGLSGYAGSDGSTGNEAVWVRRTSGTVTINVSGGPAPSIRTDGAIVNVVTGQRTLTITGVPTGAEYRLYIKDPTVGKIGTTELQGAESWTGGNITYTYGYTADQDVALQVIADGFEEFLVYFALRDSDQTQTPTLEIEENI